MRLLALDIGEKRIGVAVSDAEGRIAMPVAVIDTRKALGDGRDLVRLVEDYEVESVVVGLPLSLDGSEGPQVARVKATADRLAQFLRVPLLFADERLSSAEASRRMAEGGLSEKDRRGSVDKIAAAIFLQSYLDARCASDDKGDD